MRPESGNVRAKSLENVIAESLFPAYPRSCLGKHNVCDRMPDKAFGFSGMTPESVRLAGLLKRQ
jgi:hypothetical protein